MKRLTTLDFSNIKDKVEEGLSIDQACKALNIPRDEYYKQASDLTKREISSLGSCQRSGRSIRNKINRK